MEKQIQEIMENFNFKKVHDVMTFLRWDWFNGEGPYSVPSIKQIKETSLHLLEDISKTILDEENYTRSLSTGGLCATISFNESRIPVLELSFILEEFQVYREE